jgi:hypothetical protein
LDLLIKMANMSSSPSALKCIAFCFFHFQVWLWGLKLSAIRAPVMRQCFDSMLQKFQLLQSPLLPSSDFVQLSEGLSSLDCQHLSEAHILVTKCSDMLVQVESRTALFHNCWTAAAPHSTSHSSTCGICMDDLGDADVRAVCCPGCHVFHLGCLEDFLVFSSICSGQSFVCCPYCRFKLPNS